MQCTYADTRTHTQMESLISRLEDKREARLKQSRYRAESDYLISGRPASLAAIPGPAASRMVQPPGNGRVTPGADSAALGRASDAG